MDKLRETLREHLFINYIPLSKLFFRKYAYKVEVHLERYITKKQASYYGFMKYPGLRWEHALGVAKIACEDIQGTYKTRRQGPFCAFYFENEDDALSFTAQSKPFISEIVAPMNDDERDTLLDDATVRIRKTLFWGKYRWSVQLKWMQDEEWANLRELAEVTYPQPAEQPDIRCHLDGGYPRRAYFNDQNDLLQFRIMASDHLYKIEKAVLREEI